MGESEETKRLEWESLRKVSALTYIALLIIISFSSNSEEDEFYEHIFFFQMYKVTCKFLSAFKGEKKTIYSLCNAHL